MKDARKSKRKRREHLGNRLALLGVTFVVGSMAFVVNMRSSSLKEKDLEYQAREESLRKQVDEEKQRAARLEEQRVYVQTKQYIEKVAKEKLGLVNPDEILLNRLNKKEACRIIFETSSVILTNISFDNV